MKANCHLLSSNLVAWSGFALFAKVSQIILMLLVQHGQVRACSRFFLQGEKVLVAILEQIQLGKVETWVGILCAIVFAQETQHCGRTFRGEFAMENDYMFRWS